MCAMTKIFSRFRFPAIFIKSALVLVLGVTLIACVDNAENPTDPDNGNGPSKSPTLVFDAAPDIVVAGETATLTWTAANATTCIASGAWSGEKTVQGAEEINLLIQASTFTLQCSGAGGSVSKTVTVTVTDPAPTMNFTANPASVAYNASSMLTWSSTNATACSASGAWSGDKSTSGTFTLASLNTSGTYTLTCSGSGGSANESVTITVLAPLMPTVTISANPAMIAYNESTTLTWSSTDATTCAASNAWSGTKTTSGMQTLEALTSTGMYTLTCSGAGGSVVRSVTVTVQPQSTMPTLIFNATPLTVANIGSTTLSWLSTNTTSCSASGAWNGTKATSGTQIFNSLTVDMTYVLTCSGGGGTTSQSVTVTVQAAAAPAISLSANPANVAYNSSTTLTWSSTNAAACSASGAWTGSKAISGNEIRAALTANGTYTLTCTGPGGSTNQSVTVIVVSGTAGTITGSVDSSRINRNGVNKVYLYAGTVTPDDYDGDSGDPMASATVVQDENACGFSYSFTNVVAGNYTIGFTNQAGNDRLGQDDTLSFIGTANIIVGSSALAKNFSASRVLTVGNGKSYATPSAAAAIAASGDVIEIDAGVYQNDVVVWRQNRLTLRGVGGRAHVQGTQVIPYMPGVDTQNGMGIWVTNGSGIVVENIEFSGARVTDKNGAGIRANGNGLTVCNGYFHDNENGILGGAGEVLIEYSEFNQNGFGDGYTHNLYIDGAVTRFVFRHNYTHRARIGHELKSRAVENHILYNRLMNEDGNASYTIDIPNGGLTYIVGNLVQQGPNTDNSTVINYGSEGLLAGRTHKLYLINNTLVNDRSGGIFINAASGTSAIQLTNNLFVGTGTDVSGPSAAITKTTNRLGSSADLVNQPGYDYHLTGASPAINQGSDPGLANGFDLRPKYHYADTAKRTTRPGNGNYDIGAYEN